MRSGQLELDVVGVPEDQHGAVPALQRGLAIAQEHESPHGITANALYLAYALVLLGRHEPGLEALTRALEKPIAFMPQWTRYHTLPAVAYLLAGRLEEAAREAEQGLVLVTERQALGYRAPLLRVQAEIRMRQEPPDVEGAAHRLAEALALATELGMRPEIARCRQSLARLHRRMGKRASAAEHLAAAVGLFRVMGAAFWAERVEAEGSGSR